MSAEEAPKEPLPKAQTILARTLHLRMRAKWDDPNYYLTTEILGLKICDGWEAIPLGCAGLAYNRTCKCPEGTCVPHVLRFRQDISQATHLAKLLGKEGIGFTLTLEETEWRANFQIGSDSYNYAAKEPAEAIASAAMQLPTFKTRNLP